MRVRHGFVAAAAAVALLTTAAGGAPGASAQVPTEPRSEAEPQAQAEAEPQARDLAAARDAAYRWVRAATFDLLGRPATNGEIGSLGNRLTAVKPTSHGTIARELARSPEWTGKVVTDLYLHVLGREPDAAGLAYWVERLRTGDRVASVAVSIYGSPEYYATAGSTPTGYVEDLYESVLDRAPEPGGLAYWVGRLETGTSSWVVARAVFLSFEARGDRVDALYRTLLGRAASTADRAYWADRLVREDDIVLAAQLVASPEYRARALTRADAEPPPDALSSSIFGAFAFGVSGDGNTTAYARSGYFSLDLAARDAGSGLVEQVAPLALGGGIFPASSVSQPSLSDDGRYVVVSDALRDLYGNVGNGQLFDRLTGATTALDPAAAPGTVYEPAISPDGGAIAYRLRTGPTDDVLVRDRTGGTSVPVAAGNGDSIAPRLSGDGRWVVFSSIATDLVADDDNRVSDVFLHDRGTGTTTRLTDGDRHSGQPWISADGSTVAFTSTATDLVPGDDGDDGPARDGFVWTRSTGEIVRVSDGQQDVSRPSVSGDGRFVAFRAPGSAPAVWDRATGSTSVLASAPGLLGVHVTTDGGEVVGQAYGEGVDPFPRWELDDVDRLLVTPATLPDAAPGEAYEAEVEVVGGTDPAIVDARLPRGLELDGTTISGTATFRPGVGIATLLVADEAGHRSLQRRAITLPAPGTLAHLAGDPVSSTPPSLSADGSRIAYAQAVSGAHEGNIVIAGPGDTRTTVAAGHDPSLSDDGTVVAYVTYDPGPGRFDAFVTGPGGTERILEDASGGDRAVALSADASTVVVATEGSPLAPADPGPGTFHVDLATGTVTRVGRDTQGAIAASADGGEVALVEPAHGGGQQVVLWEAATGTRTVVEQSATHTFGDVQLSADAAFVAFTRTTAAYPPASSVRTWTRATGVVTEIASAAPGRNLGSTAMSGDGGTILFSSNDPAVAPGSTDGRPGDVYRWDRATGLVTWIVAPASASGGSRQAVALSADGRVAGLASTGPLVSGAGAGYYTWTDD